MSYRLSNWSVPLEPELVEACQDPEIQRRLPVPVPYRLEDAHFFVTSIAPGYFGSGGGNFAVVDDGGRLAGCVSVWPIDGAARLGYWVAPAFRGRGVATAAARLAAEWAFAQGFEVLELTIGADNPASQAVARKAGFVFVEDLPGYEISPGMFKDTVRLRRYRDV